MVSYRKRGLANLAVFRSQNTFGKWLRTGITSQMAQFAAHKPIGETHMAFKTDIEIALEAKKKPIMEIGAKLGIPS